MWRWLVLSVALLALPVHAQDRAQTLADIKAELGLLMAEFTALKSETVATGATGGSLGAGDALQRMDAIEAELMRLTSRAEEIELRLTRVVSDGTNRIGDIDHPGAEAAEGKAAKIVINLPEPGRGKQPVAARAFCELALDQQLARVGLRHLIAAQQHLPDQAQCGGQGIAPSHIAVGEMLQQQGQGRPNCQ